MNDIFCQENECKKVLIEYIDPDEVTQILQISYPSTTYEMLPCSYHEAHFFLPLNISNSGFELPP